MSDTAVITDIPVADLRYSSETAMKVSGLSYRKLDYFLRTIQQKPDDMPGSGHQRRFTLADLLLLTALSEMIDAGLPPSKAWKIITDVTTDPTAVPPVSININWSAIGDLVQSRLST